MTSLVFDEAAHRYTYEGQVIQSVTQIIKPLYEGAFDFVDPAVLNAKAALGTAVHTATELFDKDDLDESSIDDRVRPYLDAWVKFRKDTGFVPDGIEYRLFHPTLRYAGTLDRTGTMDSGEWGLNDIKIVSVLHPAVGVQLAAYESAYLASLTEEQRSKKPKRITRRAVQLRDDGTYRLSPIYRDPQDLTCFMSLLNISRWKEKNNV